MHVKRVLIPILIMYAVFALFRFSLTVTSPEILREFNLTPYEVGLMFSSLLLSLASGMISAGKISEKIGERGVHLVGVSTLSFTLTAIYFSQSYYVLLALIVMAGFGSGVVIPSVYSLSAEWRPKARGFMLGLANSIYSIGGIIGSFASGATIQRFGWRFIFLPYSLISFLCLIPLMKSRGSSYRHAKGGVKLSYRDLIKRKDVLKSYLGIFFANFGFVAGLSWYPIYLEMQGISVEFIGLTFTLLSLFGALGSLMFGALSDRFGREMTVSLISLSTAIICFYYTIEPHNPRTYMVLTAIFGLFSFSFWPIFISIAQSAVSRDESIAVTGLVQNASVIGGMLSPTIVGILASMIKLSVALTILTSLPFLAAFLTITSFKLLES